MIPLADARATVLAGCPVAAPVDVAITDALGCVLAAPVVSAEAVPPFANTAMDGFAVQAADTASVPARLRVIGTLAAGAAPTIPVGKGEAIRIMTGAPVPPGADAIVPVVAADKISARPAIVGRVELLEQRQRVGAQAADVVAGHERGRA